MLNFVAAYWYLFAIAFLAVVLFVVDRWAKSHAKSVAMQYLQKAEAIVFDSSDAKIAAVSLIAYKALPERIKLFVPYVLFEIIVTELYNGIKSTMQANTKDVPNVPATPIADTDVKTQQQ